MKVHPATQFKNQHRKIEIPEEDIPPSQPVGGVGRRTGQIFIDEKETQKIAEQSNLIFDGSSKDGYTEYISSMNTISKDISSRINKYDNLIEEARRNARNHIERIAYSMCGNSFSYSVKFSSESGGENNE